jgi:hypothetical protein
MILNICLLLIGRCAKMTKKRIIKVDKDEALINPYSFKQKYEWSKMDARDWFFSFGRFDNGEILANEKYRELNLIIIRYIGRWNNLKGQISGRDANMNITLSHYGNPLHWDFLQRLFNIDERKYPDIQDREEMVGCVYAADETNMTLIASTYKYWNVALIKIWGHNANVIYDNDIGEKETYVLDPWLTQRPDVYKWDDWPFETKNKYTIIHEHKRISRSTSVK